MEKSNVANVTLLTISKMVNAFSEKELLGAHTRDNTRTELNIAQDV